MQTNNFYGGSIEMNKTELIAAIAEKAGVSKKDAEKVVNATFDVITTAMSDGDKVSLVGFGNFEVSCKRRQESSDRRKD